MTDIILSASILSAADFSRLGDEIRSAEQAGVDMIHVDVMDGMFVPNITMGPFIVDALHKMTALPLDVHLMIEKPENHIRAFREAGASILTVHIENTPHINKILQEIHSLGSKAGIALNPGTPASSISAVIPQLDQVLVMTVNPGFSGQSFIPYTVEKIAQVHSMLTSQQSHAVIQVDGGINVQTLPLVVKAGARSIVAATAIFKHPQGIAAGVQTLRHCVA